MYNNNDDEVISDNRYIKPEWNQKDNHLTLALIIVSLSLSIVGASYYYHLKHMEELVAEANIRNNAVDFKSEKITNNHKATTSVNPQQYKQPILSNQNYIEQTEPNKSSRKYVLQKSPYTQQQKLARSQRIKTDAQRRSLETCNYWSNQYRKEPSDYNRRLMSESCNLAGYAVRTRPQTQQKIIINNINNYRENKPQSQNGCTSKRNCSIYKTRLNRILSKMRAGYSPNEYNYLEGNRKRWRNKIFDYCKCHKTNSF
ncbi:MAG: hypothetical protein V3U84_03870 [Thiotrichaceae bacterium]